MNYFELKVRGLAEPSRYAPEVAAFHRKEKEKGLRKLYGLGEEVSSDQLNDTIAAHAASFKDVVVIDDDIRMGQMTTAFLTELGCEVRWLQQFFRLGWMNCEVLEVTDFANPSNGRVRQTLEWGDLKGRLVLLDGYSNPQVPGAILATGRGLTPIVTLAGLYAIGHSTDSKENGSMSRIGTVASVLKPVSSCAPRAMFNALESAMSWAYQLQRQPPQRGVDSKQSLMDVIRQIASLQDRLAENKRSLPSDYDRGLEAILSLAASENEATGERSGFFTGEFHHLSACEMIDPVWQLLCRLAEYTSATPPVPLADRRVSRLTLGDIRGSERRYMTSRNPAGHPDARILDNLEMSLNRKLGSLRQEGIDLEGLLVLAKNADRVSREALLLGQTQRLLNRLS